MRWIGREWKVTKKIVHLTNVLFRYDQRMLWREAYSLQAHGYNVTIVVNDTLKNEILENGIKIVSTGFVPVGRRQRMTEGVQRIYELGLAQDADIYHLHETELLTVALKLKQHGKKVIFDSHEFYGENIKGREWIPKGCRHLMSFLYNQYETYVCRRIDGVISVAYWKGKDWFEGRSRCSVQVGNYPRIEEYENILPPDYSMRRGICYSGGLEEERGITHLIEAGRKTGEAVFLAGRFSSPAYQRKITNDTSNVHYLGFFSDRKALFKMYAHCAIGASLLLNVGQYAKLENLPTKVYEYMAMSMPVLISDFPYNSRLIEKYRFGLVANPDDVDDIAEAIHWLVRHPKEAEEMGKNGRRLFMEKFTWEFAAEPELLRLYREVE